MMVISNFTAIRKQNGADDHSLIVLRHQYGDDTEAVREDWTNCPDPREGDVLRTCKIARIQQMLIS